MGLEINFTITGADAIDAKFKDVARQVKDFQSSEPKKIADDMVTKMQAKAPVDTGFLRDHISVTNSDDTTAQVSSTADYSIYVELGTRYQQANSFFFSVFDEYSAQDMIDDFHSAVSL